MRSSHNDLTKRESEIMALLVEGLSRPDIAKQLGVSVKTVTSHILKARDRLDANTVVHAAVIYVRGF